MDLIRTRGVSVGAHGIIFSLSNYEDARGVERNEHRRKGDDGWSVATVFSTIHMHTRSAA